jgi:SEC-C motif domain protein
MRNCYCNSNLDYAQCCEPYHHGTPAPSPTALMRSRYSAYVLKLEYYLLDTWHPKTKPKALHLNEDVATKWLGLSIKGAQEISPNTAEVEFIARYKVGGGKAERLHEISQFERLDNRWYYKTGQIVL